MKDWKIGTRIAAGFAAVILIAVCLGVFAYNATVNIQKSGDALSKDYLPSVTALSHVQVNVYRKVILMREAIASTDARQQSEYVDKMKAYTDSVSAALASYEAVDSTKEEKALYEKVKEARAPFLAKSEEIRQLYSNGTAAGRHNAELELKSELIPLLMAYSDSMQALTDHAMKGSDDGLAAVNGSVSSAKSGVIIGLVITVLLAAFVALYIVRSITQPLALAVGVLERVAQCDMTATLDIHTKDEIGQMADALNSAVSKLRNTLQEVAGSARGASSSSQELSAAAEAIASGAQEQAASLEETSASLEEITATVRQSADNARQANQLANSSKESAERGQEVVLNAVGAMGEINVASAKISDIISTIDEIAFQTNLLAVNAAVEAARAGEEGRGFAVVASEVRSLAQRSAGAAKEIKGLIQDTLKKVERGSELVNRSGETLQDIIGSVKRVTDIVGEISAAADEQSTGVDQVNTAVTQIDQVTQSNSSQTEELAATANSLSDQARRLTKLVSVFRLSEGEQDAPEPASERPSRPVATKKPSVRTIANKIKAKATLGGPLLAPVTLAAAGVGADDSFEEF